MQLRGWFRPLNVEQSVPHPALVRHAEERASHVQARLADGITAFSGSMLFVYIHAIWFVAWVVLEPFGDNFPYGLLTMLVSLEAIFLGTFILISQNRADERRQALAAEEWRLVQMEEVENQQIMELTQRIYELTAEVHRLTAEVHARVTPVGSGRTAATPDA